MYPLDKHVHIPFVIYRASIVISFEVASYRLVGLYVSCLIANNLVFHLKWKIIK